MTIAEWPAWARWISDRRRTGEKGVGDTAKRIFAVMGGEQYSLLRCNLRMPCRCAQRQAEWNEKYAYPVSGEK